jgi:hypothetical protein
VLLNEKGTLTCRIYLQLAAEGVGPHVYYVERFPHYIYPSCLLIIETLKNIETGEMVKMPDFVRDVGKMLSAMHQQSTKEFQPLMQVVFTFIIFEKFYALNILKLSSLLKV